MSEDRNADIIDFEYEFADGSRWKVKETDSLLGTNYVLLVRQDTVLDPAPTRIQTANDVRRRMQLDREKAGQTRLFEGPS